MRLQTNIILISLLIVLHSSCRGQMNIENKKLTLYARCIEEKAKVKSLQAWGFRQTGGRWFDPSGDELKKMNPNQNPEVTLSSFSSNFFYTAFKDDALRLSSILSNSAIMNEGNKYDINNFKHSLSQNIFSDKTQLYSVTFLKEHKNLVSSGKMSIGTSLFNLGLAQYDSKKWPNELLNQNSFSVSQKTKDAKYGEVYECGGTMEGLNGSQAPTQIKFWIAPEYNCRIIRSESFSGNTRTIFTLDEMIKVSGIWLPKRVTVSWADDASEPHSHDNWEFEKISLNDVQEKDVRYQPALGDTGFDKDTQKRYHIGENGERIPFDLPTDNIKPNYFLGWLYMASVTTLLVLTVGAYVKWKRNQLTKSS